jgi:transcriptional regulator of acetoin/glycerol metabolism
MTSCVMAISGRSSASFGTLAGHAQHVGSVAEGAAPLPGLEEVSSSWQRSATKYGVDPVDSKAPRILTSGELKNCREPLDRLIFRRPSWMRRTALRLTRHRGAVE